jgi:NAD(P)-dependent dehydrogenase (short-subunit alcohol dehydrogenase family)
LEQRNATAAVIGAGDYIGAAIAKKFAAEGFVVFAGRRNGEKLAPLVADIEASGGRIVARSLDARKEDDITAFLQDADRRAQLEDRLPAGRGQASAAGGVHFQHRSQACAFLANSATKASSTSSASRSPITSDALARAWARGSERQNLGTRGTPASDNTY